MDYDTFLTIGDSHDICEDYVRKGLWSNNKGSYPYVILSDGCSSAPDTDIGSRLLTKESELYIARGNHNKILNQEVFSNLLIEKGKLFNIHPDSFSATLGFIITYSSDNKNFCRTFLFGDGVIVAKKKDGDMYIMSREYKSGAPYYIAYARDRELVKDYEVSFGIEQRTNVIHISKDNEITKLDSYEEYLKHKIKLDILVEFDQPLIWDIDQDEFDFVGIMSDGVLSFKDENNDIIPLETIVQEMFNFKNHKGDFVKRRMKKAFKKFKENKWYHYDDVSISVIYLGES